jgi:copper(I)-binding protein
MRVLMAAILSVICAGLTSLSPQMAEAHEYEAGSVLIEHPTVNPTPAGSSATAGYMTLLNRGRTPDRLVSAASPLAERVEIHETYVGAGGMVGMRTLSGGLVVPPNGRAVLSPAGLHLMITGLRQPLRQGEALPLTLHFERGGRVEILASVERVSASAREHHGGHMQ